MDDLNLNNRLFSNNSPLVRGTVVSAMDFDSQTERDAVTSTHVRNLSFNKISGGTCSLGGLDNGDGLMTVANAAGSEIVRADNTGLTVSNGSITIQNSAG